MNITHLYSHAMSLSLSPPSMIFQPSPTLSNPLQPITTLPNLS